ncbi:MAG: YchF/TatD family DNA exonuclease [Candidatus Kapabacteria bacterium]|nr:YchF/TatD family DNA exonuclease [Candidatus Kapabacteria bacterium]
MIDTHAHIDVQDFDDIRDDILKRAEEANIEKIIIPAIEPKTFNKLIEVANSSEKLCFGIGIHPHNSNEVNGEAIKLVEQIINEHNPVAVGEIGLDYYYDFSPPEVQKKLFREHLKLAKKYQLPVIVHNRDAFEDIFAILEDEQDGTLTGVLHCFSGNPEQLEKALDLGFNVSFTGNITFKKTNLEETVLVAPLDKILLETDSPWMAPVPHRGKKNEPAFIKFIAEKIAEIKKISIDEVIKMTTKNAKTLFKIVVLLLLFTFYSFPIIAQTSKTEEGGFKDIFSEEEEVYNPYEKSLGIGGFLGTNTIVQSIQEARGTRDVSYEGILFYGGMINFFPWEFMSVQLGYVYSKNTKIVEKSKNQLGPNIHQVIELGTQWYVNPNSRLNFFGTLGPSIIFNKFGEGTDKQKENSSFAINTGIGFNLNIPFTGVGLLTLAAEWRLSFDMTVSDTYGVIFNPNDPNDIKFVEQRVTSFFSLPRIVVTFYPFNRQ